MEAVLVLGDGRAAFGSVHARKEPVISPKRRRNLDDRFAFVKLVSPDYLLRKEQATEFEQASICSCNISVDRLPSDARPPLIQRIRDTNPSA